MARLLRSQSQSSRLRPPTVVGPPVTYPPVRVKLTLASRLGRRASFRLRPPMVVGPAVTFAPVRVKLVRQPRADQKASYVLRPPRVVASSVTFAPLQLRLVKGRKPPRVTSTLRPPATFAVVVSFVAGPLTVRLVRSLPRRPVLFKLQAPAVTGPGVTFAPIRLRLAQPPRATQRTRSTLRPPGTFQAVTQALAVPLRVLLARVRPQSKAASRIRPPAVVNSAVTFTPVQVRLARSPAPRKVQSRLQPPVSLAVVVAAIFAPVRVLLARQTRPRATASRLRPPLSFAVVFAPVRVLLARGRRPTQTSSRVSRPLIVGAATVFRPVKTWLTAQPLSAPRRARSLLRAPAVVFSATYAAVTGYFQNRPSGATGNTPDEADLGVTPGGQTGSTPAEGDYDSPNPRGRT